MLCPRIAARVAPWTIASIVATAQPVIAQQSPAYTGPRNAAACLISAWNAYDSEAARRCYTAHAVAVRGGQRIAIDWEAERGYRAFDAVAHSRFQFEIAAATDSTVEIVLHEQNEFLQALGLSGVTARWYYLVAGDLIAAEQHLQADSAFARVFREFTAWGRRSHPEGWTDVVDHSGDVVFSGSSAPLLIKLALKWARSET